MVIKYKFVTCSNSICSYMDVLNTQRKFETPFNELLDYTGLFMIGFGMLFVITSFYQLGWCGTFHGKF